MERWKGGKVEKGVRKPADGETGNGLQTRMQRSFGMNPSKFAVTACSKSGSGSRKEPRASSNLVTGKNPKQTYLRYLRYLTFPTLLDFSVPW